MNTMETESLSTETGQKTHRIFLSEFTDTDIKVSTIPLQFTYSRSRFIIFKSIIHIFIYKYKSKNPAILFWHVKLKVPRLDTENYRYNTLHRYKHNILIPDLWVIGDP